MQSLITQHTKHTEPQHIPTQYDMLPQHLVCKYQLNCEYCNITLARNKTPWWWSDKIETCRSVLKCFMWNYMCIRWSINWSDTICCINTIWRPDDEHRVARNMYRIIIINTLYNVIVHQVGHLPRVIGEIHFNLSSLRHMLFACYNNFYTQAQLEVTEKVQ